MFRHSGYFVCGSIIPDGVFMFRLGRFSSCGCFMLRLRMFRPYGCFVFRQGTFCPSECFVFLLAKFRPNGCLVVCRCSVGEIMSPYRILYLDNWCRSLGLRLAPQSVELAHILRRRHLGSSPIVACRPVVAARRAPTVAARHTCSDCCAATAAVLLLVAGERFADGGQRPWGRTLAVLLLPICRGCVIAHFGL